MLHSILVHKTDASSNPLFQRTLAHWLSIIPARPFHFVPPVPLLGCSPVLDICEQVYHTLPLTAPSFACLCSLFFPQTPCPPLVFYLNPLASSLTSASGSQDDVANPLVFI